MEKWLQGCMIISALQVEDDRSRWPGRSPNFGAFYCNAVEAIAAWAAGQPIRVLNKLGTAGDRHTQ